MRVTARSETRLGRRIAGGLTLLPYLLVALGPVAWLLTSLSAGVPDQLLGARPLTLLGRSFGLALGASALATGIGFGAALWMASGHGPLRRAARATYLAPLLLPSHAAALTWVVLLGQRSPLRQVLEALTGTSVSPYGLGAAVLVLALTLFPVVVLFALARLDTLESALVESGRLFAADGRVWWKGVLPMALPSALTGGALVFCLALVDFGVPAMLQVPVYAMEIQAEFAQSGDPGRSTWTALPLLLLGVGFLLAALASARQTPVVGHPATRGSLHRLAVPKGLKVWMGIAMAFAVLSVGGPVAVLVIQAGSPAPVLEAIRASHAELGLSLAVALAAGLLAALIALPVARRVAPPGNRSLLVLCLLPLAIPAPLIGIALVHLGAVPGLASLADTGAWLVLAHVCRLLPIALIALALDHRRIDPLLRDAAAVHAPSPLRRVLWVDLPLAGPGMVVAVAAVLVFSLGELGTTVLVAPPGYGTFSVKLFNLLHYGASEVAAGMVLCLVLLVVATWGVVLTLRSRVRR
ncbi:MAG: iron ABC transporter permease [Deltaproteobacteria bacterium]|nr:iron ABC transporter permease [Deltaproteobacteria bacterium]